MTTKYKIQNTNPKRGAALLMAVLLASVMLSVGLGVYQRTYKQLVFASFWRQTQIAFAAADGGLECALYWDLHPAVGATCFNSVPAVSATWNPTTASPYTQSFTVPTSDGCVNVTIRKPSPVVPYLTRIESRGYNVSCATVSTNPRVVERALKIDY